MNIFGEIKSTPVDTCLLESQNTAITCQNVLKPFPHGRFFVDCILTFTRHVYGCIASDCGLSLSFVSELRVSSLELME